MGQSDEISDALLGALVCPRDLEPLQREKSSLVCPKNHCYPVVDGVPVFLISESKQTIGIAACSLEAAEHFSRGRQSPDPFYTSTLGITDAERQRLLEDANSDGSGIDPVAKYMIGATNGILYRELIGKVSSYAIPELRLPQGTNQLFLDIGCNWGRWSIAAARHGYLPFGIDPSLGAVMAARRVASELGLQAHFIVGDSRFLPFASGTFDIAFSYSVLQHFSREDVRSSLRQIQRVVKPGGRTKIQMPNALGVRSVFHQIKRRFKRPSGFDVRYWSVQELAETFAREIGPTSVSIDCFFGLGLQKSDEHLMSARGKWLIGASERLRRLGRWMPWLKTFADSVYVDSIKPAGDISN